MSYTCDPKRLRLWGAHFGTHVRREIYSGVKMANRAGSAYEFFNRHGLKINFETVDGSPLPDEIKAKLSVATPPHIGSRLGKRKAKADDSASSTVANTSEDDVVKAPLTPVPAPVPAVEPANTKKPAPKRVRKATAKPAV